MSDENGPSHLCAVSACFSSGINDVLIFEGETIVTRHFVYHQRHFLA